MQLRADPVEGGESVRASWLVSSLAPPEAGGG